MTKKIIGTVMLVIGGLGIAVLLTYGGPVFPHIFGSAVLAVIGAAVLLFKKQTK